MPKITQGQVFEYLCSEILIGKDDNQIAEIFADTFVYSATSAASYFSNIKNGNKGGWKLKNDENMPEKLDKFFQELFCPINRDDEEKMTMMKNVSEFIKNKGDSDWKIRFDDTFETYIKRFLKNGLLNNKIAVNTSAPQEQDDISALTQSENTPPAFQADSPAYSLRPDNTYNVGFFTGREDLVDKMKEHLESDKIVILTGMGGIGKTQLAKWFAEKGPLHYKTKQWVSGEKTSDFKSAVLALRFYGLKDEKDSYNKRCDLLWGLNEETLIIIDNVDTPWDRDTDFEEFRRVMNLHLIITSRLTESSYAFPEQLCLKVDSLPLEEQRDLFLYYYEKNGKRLKKPHDYEILNEILKRIEGHTLLIELIAKTEASEHTIDEVLKWLNGQETVFSFEDNEKAISTELIKRILQRTKMDDKQKSLLRWLAFLPTEGVSRSLLLRELLEKCRDASSQLRFLENRSLAIREGTQTRIHPVIRKAVRDDMPKEWDNYDEFLRMIQTAMESSSGNNENLLSLCHLAGGMCEALHDNKIPPALWDCLRAIAKYCDKACQYETGRKLLELLARIEDGMDKEKRIDLHLSLGRFHQSLADYPRAEEHYCTALNMTEQDDDWRGSCFNSLAVVYRKDAQYEKAEEYFEKALKCYKQEGLIATAQNDLGIVYLNRGDQEADLDKKTEYYRKAKDIHERNLKLREELEYEKQDAKQRDLAYSHHNIGTACHRLGEYQRALKEHQKGLKIRTDNNLHMPDIATSLNWIGKDLLQLGEFEDAKKKLEESRDIIRNVLGERHKDLAWVLYNLGECCEKMNDLPNAIQFTREAYDIWKEKLRPGHPYRRKGKTRLDELKSKLN